MNAIWRHLRIVGFAAVTIPVVIGVLGGAALGLLALAEGAYRIVAGLLVMVAGFLAVAAVLIVAILVFLAVLGRGLTRRLFFVRGRALTDDAVNDLTAQQGAAATVPIVAAQGVLRVIPVKPEWWLDDTYAGDVTPVVAVGQAEHRLPDWGPYDVAVRVGAADVVAWLPRRTGGPGRRIQKTVRVREGAVGAVVYRPSSVPELGGTLEPLDDELTGTLSFFRLTAGAALLVGIGYAVWRLSAG